MGWSTSTEASLDSYLEMTGVNRLVPVAASVGEMVAEFSEEDS